MNKLQIFINRIEKFVVEKSKPTEYMFEYYNSRYVKDKVIEKKFKLKLIGSGCSRRVFIHEDFPGIVFKLQGRGDKTCSPNYSEWSSYRKAKPCQQALLAKPIAISKNYRVLAMERADQKAMPFLKVKPFVLKVRRTLPSHIRWDLQDLYRPYSVLNLKTYMLTPHNIGILPSGELKIFDYATALTT